MRTFCSQLAFVALLSLLVGLVPSATALGSVLLTVTNTNNGTGTASVGSGVTFPVTVNVVASGTGVANSTTGIDYYFQQVSGPASAVFSIFSRDSTGSAYPFLNTPPDDAVAGEVLNPRNASDLGGGTTPAGSSKSNGTFLAAKYLLLVDPSAPAGIYMVNTFSFPGTGYSDSAQNDHQFDSQGTFTVTVTPEPSTAMLLGAAVVGLGLRRRR
jgi:PEP-CTERM motif